MARQLHALSFMRIVVLSILSLTLYLGLLLGRVEVPADAGKSSAASTHDHWRRTVDGWERDNWRTASPVAALLPHPAILAAAEFIFSLTALFAFESTSRLGRRKTSATFSKNPSVDAPWIK